MAVQTSMQKQYLAAEQSLTGIEALGLQSRHDLANGHASQELAPSQLAIIGRLSELWEAGAKMKSREAELLFKDAFWKLAESPSLASYGHFKICPTASNSIDTAATWLAEKRLKTALIEPTFDNLYLILKRRGVALEALPETQLYHEPLEDALSRIDADAIFLVNPNNPTGWRLSKSQLETLAMWCARNNKVLVLDNTFRFFVPQEFDQYHILIDSRATFISLEDTGKVWQTQEIKASLLFCSPDIIQEIDIIYDEIFLCASNFALGILAQFLLDAHKRGLAEAVRKEVSAQRLKFRNAIDGNILAIHPDSLKSTISVEWVQIRSYFANDIDLAEHFKVHNLVLLPGRQFHWSRKGAQAVSNCARFALLKSKKDFLEAVDFLGQELRRLAP